jgi:hypothetical protein
LPIDSVHLNIYIILPSGFDEYGHYKTIDFDRERREQACPRMSIFARNVKRSLLLFSLSEITIQGRRSAQNVGEKSLNNRSLPSRRRPQERVDPFS